MKGCYEWLKNLGYIRFVYSVNDIALAYQEIKDVDCIYDNSSILRKMNPLIDAIKELEKRIKDLEEENAILKKAAAIFAQNQKT